MNGKKAKKIRQYYNRDVKKMVQAELRVLNKLLRARPKHMPPWLWLALMSIFFQPHYIQKQREALKKIKSLKKQKKQQGKDLKKVNKLIEKKSGKVFTNKEGGVGKGYVEPQK